MAFLAKRCSELDPVFRALIDQSSELDQFYIPTRDPDALADPAVPFETYTVEQATEAIRLASAILDTVRPKL